MKNVLILLSFLLASYSYGQNIPKPSDPCEKMDTNKLKEMLIGTWVDVQDTTHVMTITEDSVEETILVTMGRDVHRNISFWNWGITDNIFSTDAVTCYSVREYKEDYAHHTDLSINSIDANYMLTGGEGKRVFKRKR